ncbi:hypothetical protein [Rossellomorea sp. NRS-1567]
MNVEEVFKRGKKIRAEQDKAIALFIKQIRSVENMDSLESIKTELLKGSC